MSRVIMTNVLPPVHLFSRVQKEDGLFAQDVDDAQNEIVEDPIQNNEAFYDAYCAQEGLEMDKQMEMFLSSAEFDPNYEEGVFFVEATLKKDQVFLEKLVKDNPNPNARKQGLFEALTAAALREDPEMIAILGKVGTDLGQIKQYHIYSRSSVVKSCVDNLLMQRSWAEEPFHVTPDRLA